MVKHILISKYDAQDIELCLGVIGNTRKIGNTLVKVYKLKGLNFKHVKTINCLKIDTLAGVLKELEDLEDSKYQLNITCKGSKMLSVRFDVRSENVH